MNNINIDVNNNNFKISFDYDAYLVGKVKTLPNRKYSDKAWYVPTSDYKFLLELMEELKNKGYKVEFSQEAEEIIKKERNNSLESIKEIKEILVDYEFKTKPFLHQIQGFNAGISLPNLLIADEQGLGKTKQAIDIACYRKNEDKIEKCLIVAGVNTLKYNWFNEIKTHCNEEAVLIKANTPAKRLEEISNWVTGQAYFGILNIEMLRNKDIHAIIKENIDNKKINMIIVDEVHKIKNFKAQQTKAILSLNPSNKLALSGTPITKNPLDLYNLLVYLNVESRSFFTFADRYSYAGQFGGYEGARNMGELHKILEKVMIRRKKDEVMDLPEKIHNTEFVELGKEANKMYESRRKEILGRLKKADYSDNPLVQILNLRQITSGIIGGDLAKINRIIEMIQENILPFGKKNIIFSNWEEEIKLLEARLQEEGIEYVKITGTTKLAERQENIDKFQNSEDVNVIIGTIGAMGTGITLNKAEYVFFLDKGWNPSDNEQAEDRAHRIGTVGTVNVITLVVKNSIDEYIEAVLDEKKYYIEKVVEGKDVDNKNSLELISKLLNLSDKEVEDIKKAKEEKKREKKKEKQNEKKEAV